MEAAIQQHITLEEGIPCNFEITFLDADSQPVPLTGFTFKLQAKENIKNDACITLSSTNSTITTDAPNGKVILHFSGADSKNKAANLVYDLIGFDASQVPFKVAKGSIEIIQTVTTW